MTRIRIPSNIHWQKCSYVFRGEVTESNQAESAFGTRFIPRLKRVGFLARFRLNSKRSQLGGNVGNISRANKVQKSIFVVTTVSLSLAPILTWYRVIYRETASEASELNAFFISHFGAFGLLISFAILFALFLGFWLAWVQLSRDEGDLKKRYRASILHFSVTGSMIVSVLAIFDLVNDLLVFGFGSDILLQFLRFSLILAPIFLALILSSGLIKKYS
jgi:hypothetical protein